MFDATVLLNVTRQSGSTAFQATVEQSERLISQEPRGGTQAGMGRSR